MPSSNAWGLFGGVCGGLLGFCLVGFDLFGFKHSLDLLKSGNGEGATGLRDHPVRSWSSL